MEDFYGISSDIPVEQLSGIVRRKTRAKKIFSRVESIFSARSTAAPLLPIDGVTSILPHAPK
jgi:hypothetical protein